jgi:hypothetical protein
VFAYAIIFTVLMQAVEHTAVRLTTRRALAWRA